MDCSELDRGYEVSYTPTISGDYLVTVKYNGVNVEGSPFKVAAVGGGAGANTTQGNHISDLTVDCIIQEIRRFFVLIWFGCRHN